MAQARTIRSLGDGQVDFTQIFSKLTHYGYEGWAILEWECAYKHPEQGAAEGAPFIARHMIRKVEGAFDDFAGADLDKDKISAGFGTQLTARVSREGKEMDINIRTRLSAMMFLQYFVWGAWFVPFANYLKYHGLESHTGNIYSAQGWGGHCRAPVLGTIADL